MNVLMILGVTMPEADPLLLARITATLGAEGEVLVAGSVGEALEMVRDVEVILGPVTPQLFERAERLRWVHAITAGADMYLFEAFRDSGVLLSGDKGLVGSHLAETAFGLLLALSRRIARAILDGPHSWDHRIEYRREEFELEGLTMGIVGFGGTGRAIARRAAAFGMRCVAVDADPVSPSPEVHEVWGSQRFEELLGMSDVVASGLPLTPLTRGIFDAHAFTLMRPNALFVNVTRGEVVDGEALAYAVSSGQIAGAGLDVTPEEPLPAAHPLWTTPNVVMTPHTAGASQLRAGRNVDRFVRNLERFRAGLPLEGAIDKLKGY